MVVHCYETTKRRMTLNDNFRYQGHGQPLVVSGRWERGEGEIRTNNNSGSSKNANSYLGAGATPDNNQFPYYKRTDEHVAPFRNNFTHHPIATTRNMPPHFSPICVHPRSIPPNNMQEPHKQSPLCSIKTSNQRATNACEYRTIPQDPYPTGPFVFGVHNPSDFQMNRYHNDDSYDYADVVDEKSVIDNSESDNLFCDKRNNSIKIKPRLQNGSADVKRTMVTKDETRTRKHIKRKKGQKKAKAKIKCVFVGDRAVGKTSLITSYAQNVFSSEYRPTTFDKYDVVVEVDGNPISIQLCDTAGQDFPKELRELCYPGSDVIILCFSVVRPETFKSLVEHWIPAVEGLKAPFILVGTHGDLRDCPIIADDLRMQGLSPISESQAKGLAERLNAPYIETSSKTRTRLKEAFDSAILAALPLAVKKKPFWKKICCIS